MINRLRRPKYLDKDERPPLPPEAIQEPDKPEPVRLRRPVSDPPAPRRELTPAEIREQIWTPSMREAWAAAKAGEVSERTRPFLRPPKPNPPPPPPPAKKRKYWTEADRRYHDVLRAKVEQLTADNLLLKNRVAELTEIIHEQAGLPVADGWVALFHAGKA